jgi:hypothetical protein
MSRVLPLVLLFCFAPLVLAQSSEQQPRRGGPGTGNPDEHRVPWKFLQSDVLLKEQPVTLYWIPASLEQTAKSRLMTSEILREAATRCVGLEIILPERAAILDKLGVAGKVPAALLTDREGRVIRRTENVRGLLAAEDVERMLSGELSARDEAMYKEMVEANQQASAGNNTAAIDLYKKIWDDRCLFPLAGRDAQRALKNLGVTVKETPPPPPVDPNVQAPPKTETSH